MGIDFHNMREAVFRRLEGIIDKILSERPVSEEEESEDVERGPPQRSRILLEPPVPLSFERRGISKNECGNLHSNDDRGTFREI
jgi:hypothetical protein